MSEIRRIFEIKKLSFPVDGYEYDVQVHISVDAGNTYYNCGLGRLTRTLEEACLYIENYKKEHAELEDKNETIDQANFGYPECCFS